MHEVLEAFDSEDLLVMVINLSDSDRIENAKKIIVENGLEAISYYDINGSISKHYNIIGVPASFYISDDGKIKNIFYGGDTAAGIIKKIKE